MGNAALPAGIRLQIGVLVYIDQLISGISGGGCPGLFGDTRNEKSGHTESVSEIDSRSVENLLRWVQEFRMIAL
jgi:hypothetical protein